MPRVTEVIHLSQKTAVHPAPGLPVTRASQRRLGAMHVADKAVAATPRIGSGLDALSRLIGDPHDFVAHKWGQRMHRHHSSELTEIVTMPMIDRVLTSTAMPAPHFGIVAGGSLGEWSRSVASPQPGFADASIVDAPGALAAFDAGATIILYDARMWGRAVDDLAAGVEAEIGHRVGVNTYLTPGGTDGLPVHYDPHDVIIVQLHGTKRWEIFEREVEDPTASYLPERNATTGSPEIVVLDPGDTIYIPRGCPHRTSTPSGPSAHLTFAIVPTTYADLIAMLVTELANTPAGRAALPIGFHNDNDVLLDAVSQALRLLRSEVLDHPGALAGAVHAVRDSHEPREFSFDGELLRRFE